MDRLQTGTPAVARQGEGLSSVVRIGAGVGERLALALWLGGFLTVGGVVAPLAFSQLARSDAGALMGACFQRLNGIGLVCGGVLLVALAIEAVGSPVSRRLLGVRAGLIGAALAVALYLAVALFPTMESARATAARGVATPAFDRQRTFRRMHALSRQLLSLQMLLLVGVAVTAAMTTARKEPR